MSSVARPRGPLPARVYWVRRAVVLGVAFLLIFGLARLLGSGGDEGGGSDATAQQAAGQVDDQSTDHQETQGTEPTETKKKRSPKTKKPKKAPLPQPTGACDPADITVAPRLDTVAWSDKIKVPLRLSGREPACTFEVSSDSLVIKITSGSDLIWTSQQCGRLPADDVVVRSETATKVVFVWNGRRSDDECDRTAAFAKPGWYHVEVATFGGEPTSDKFELTPPEPKNVYKTEKPKPDKKTDEKADQESDEKSDKKTDKSKQKSDQDG